MIAEYYQGIVIEIDGKFPISRIRKTQTGDEKYMKNNGY